MPSTFQSLPKDIKKQQNIKKHNIYTQTRIQPNKHINPKSITSYTTDLDGGLKLQQIRLLEENFSRCSAELANIGLGKLNLPGSPGLPKLQKPINNIIKNSRVNPLLILSHRSSSCCSPPINNLGFQATQRNP